ncbi:hypothetical protein BOW53_04375 [Solemya pervernicosa gill symbiont]|uniref:Surface lipoprotein assembly modifier C-terminal domain-containing protein n=1 Tax=Solemya pervernicosa gill symbiont TaxID=642797 RepID=A0A1T2L8C3_9GAMM|nr:hypothetical protein BOW53_04375 [Solemya pervernicosa gill symbiont]
MDLLDDPQVQFLQAIEERNNGSLENAIELFKSILSEHPSLHRARLELAVAYYQALNFAEGRNQAMTVLNNPNTPANVRPKIRAFLDVLQANAQENRWSPFITLGFLYDTNVNAGPDDDTIPTGGGSIVLIPSAVARVDYGYNLSTGISHRYLAQSPISIADSEVSLVWYSKANVYRMDYNAENDRDLDLLSFSTGPTLVAARKYRAGINFSADHMRLGEDNEAYLNTYGVTPKISWIFYEQSAELTADIKLQKSDYLQDANDARDGYRYIGGLSLRKTLRRERMAVEGRVEFFDQETEEGRYAYKGSQLMLGASYQPSKRSNLYTRLQFEKSDYDELDGAFGVVRDEKKQRAIIGASHSFSKSSSLSGWTIDGSYAFTNNISNIELYEYRRKQLGIRVSRSF